MYNLQNICLLLELATGHDYAVRKTRKGYKVRVNGFTVSTGLTKTEASTYLSGAADLAEANALRAKAVEAL